MNDKIDRFYLLTKSPDKYLSCVMQKSPNFVDRQKSQILSAKIEHVLSLTILSADFYISNNKLCLCCHDDRLQQKMNIYFSNFLCMLFIFVH